MKTYFVLKKVWGLWNQIKLHCELNIQQSKAVFTQQRRVIILGEIGGLVCEIKVTDFVTHYAFFDARIFVEASALNLLHWKNGWMAGAAPLGGGDSPPLLIKVIFVNRQKPMRKYWGYGRWRHQSYLLELQPSLSWVVFKDRI